MRTRFWLLILLVSIAPFAFGQAEYIPEQLGRDSHHIIQSLGAFVGNERAESQSFDITYMPASNGVEGNMIINTADYRCTFKFGTRDDICYELVIDIRSQEFLGKFYRLFNTYPTQEFEEARVMTFGDRQIRVDEGASRSTRYRSFTLTFLETR